MAEQKRKSTSQPPFVSSQFEIPEQSVPTIPPTSHSSETEHACHFHSQEGVEVHSRIRKESLSSNPLLYQVNSNLKNHRGIKVAGKKTSHQFHHPRKRRAKVTALYPPLQWPLPRSAFLLPFLRRIEVKRDSLPSKIALGVVDTATANHPKSNAACVLELYPLGRDWTKFSSYSY